MNTRGLADPVRGDRRVEHTPEFGALDSRRVMRPLDIPAFDDLTLDALRPSREPSHRISTFDPETAIGNCLICGPTAVTLLNRGKYAQCRKGRQEKRAARSRREVVRPWKLPDLTLTISEREGAFDLQRLDADGRPFESMPVPDPFPVFLARFWTGEVPLVRRVIPLNPAVVGVYYLYGPDGLAYVGSSGNVRKRLAEHAREKSNWSRFAARECSDREAAYWLEALEVMIHRPPLNRELTVHGRVPALIAHREVLK